MSFGEAEAPQFKKFISQAEINEQKKKRQEEWDKVRKPDEPLEAPEEEYDPRSLFAKLEEQKLKKQDEYESQFKMINQVKGLDEGEANFLNEVAERQLKVERLRRKEEDEVIDEYKSSLASTVMPASTSKLVEKPPAKVNTPTSGKKSQLQLLAGAVKRKRSTSPDKGSGSKLQKPADAEQPTATDGKMPFRAAHVLGVLPAFSIPGVAQYSDSSDSESSSSDSDIDTSVFRPAYSVQIKSSCGRHADG